MQQINQGLIVSPGNGEYGVSLQETQPIMYLQDVTNKSIIARSNKSRSSLLGTWGVSKT